MPLQINTFFLIYPNSNLTKLIVIKLINKCYIIIMIK